MAGLYDPLSTLHARPRDRPRMTRGRCGSLFLHRSGLAPPTPCRLNRRTLPTPPPCCRRRLCLRGPVLLAGFFTIQLDGIASVRRVEDARFQHDEGSDSCRARTHPAGLAASVLPKAGKSWALPSEHPDPNHIVCLDIALTVTSAYRDRPSEGSRLSRAPASSPHHAAPGSAPPRRLGRGKLHGFVHLRATRSPPVAPHPASLRRSYLRLHRS